jgi:biopolymer transport protein ExbB/TolQ
VRDMFSDGGLMMWPLLATAAGILWLSARTALRLAGGDRARIEDAGRGLPAILFWGAMAAVLGLLGTVIGIIVMTQQIQLAGAVEPSLVWAGVGVTLNTFVFGLLVFLLSAVSWFVLRQWHGRAEDRVVAGGG